MKMASFLDCNPNKSQIANDDQLIRQNFQFPDLLVSTQDALSQSVEENPINIEAYSVFQHAISHLSKLNDFLRTEQFVE